MENKVGYERRNMFVPISTILDFDCFNKELLLACEKDMRREHYRKGELISTLFEADKKAMLPINSIDFKVSKLHTARADKYGKVMFETNRYSSSPKLAQDRIYLEVTSDTVTIMDVKYNHIVTHERMYEKDSEAMNWLPYISLMAKRPTAFKYTGFYQELPEIWQSYLSDLPSEKKREALLTLNTMLEKHDIKTAANALEVALRVGVKDTDSILASYYSLTKKVQPMQPMQLTNPSTKVPSFQTDTKRYDCLFKLGGSQ